MSKKNPCIHTIYEIDRGEMLAYEGNYEYYLGKSHAMTSWQGQIILLQIINKFDIVDKMLLRCHNVHGSARTH